MIRLCLVVATLALQAPSAQAEGITGHARVTDGDTLDLAGETVRLSGIDAPELHQSCARADGTAWPCGDWARDRLAALTEGQHVTCAGDTRDRYGRLVATCTVAGRDIGAAMVAQGAAIAFRRYSSAYINEEKAALFAGTGVWQGGFQTPEAYRAALRDTAPTPQPDTACPIKGNISSSGRIYHLPGQEDYDATRIDTRRGERWFCSEDEAIAAGWRRARR
jgi:endonuclease YncB( thermonuclease family)